MATCWNSANWWERINGRVRPASENRAISFPVEEAEIIAGDVFMNASGHWCATPSGQKESAEHKERRRWGSKEKNPTGITRRGFTYCIN